MSLPQGEYESTKASLVFAGKIFVPSFDPKTSAKSYIKQLLDEVEHDIMNYQHSKGLSNQADIELDMINAISAGDIAFIISSSQAIVN